MTETQPWNPFFEFSRKRENNPAWRIRHDPLERDPFRREFGRRGATNPRGAHRALPHLLAADLLFYRAARSLSRGRRGSDAGFL